MSKVWKAQSPSNIALIKYMGKKVQSENIPANASLSWTLNHLKTSVELTETEQRADSWEALPSDYPFEMSAKGLEKYLGHMQRLKSHFGVSKNFVVRSANNFPADCGIASSASSFAALTEVCCEAFSEISGNSISREEKALLSARGSGSSCRSFFDGMVEWKESGVGQVDHPFKSLNHMVILVGQGKKDVSSSEAHKKVETSLLYPGRIERCEERLGQLKESWIQGNWQRGFEIVWNEFWDMHALFETSQPPFGYFEPGTLEVLEKLRQLWKDSGDGPWVTMDAGPNIHLIWREDQTVQGSRFFNNSIKGRWSCLSNFEEIGFAQV